MKTTKLLIVVLSMCFCGSVRADIDATKEWWRDAKFGLFVHWGPISILGKEISWSRDLPRTGEEYATWDRSVPSKVYDSLYKEFNPVAFNADGWVRMMKDAGMKYIVFTTKHHDGFVNFDSKYTDYKITSKDCPFGRDIVKELADACHKAGIGLGLYYSPPDWHNPDYLGPEHDTKYIRYFHGQVEELCRNYGKIDIFWFDGLRGNAEDWHAGTLVERMKKWQPDMLINNRLGVEGHMGTPEQSVGGFNRAQPWESCVTLGTQWTWGGNDKTKSYEECMKLLLGTAGGDGNLLLNLGPRPDGRFEATQIAVIKRMGDWLKKYGESIYATRGGPFMPGKFGVSTCKGNKIYVHITEFGGEKVKLGALPAKIVRATLMTGGECRVAQNDKGVEITVAKKHQQPIDTLVSLEVDADARAIRMIEPLAKAAVKDLHPAAEPVTKPIGKTPKVVFKNDESELVAVPAGAYVNHDGKKIRLDKYSIQKHEVTNAMFCEYLGSSDDAAKAYCSRMQIEQKQAGGRATYSVEPGKENYPIVFVTYDAAADYARWMSRKTGRNYSLPTEAQWEKAAGWDSEKQHFYAYGIQTDEIRPLSFACSTSICYNRDVPDGYAAIAVGSFAVTSPVGCYDMSGNVREWTSDKIDNKMIMKGGSFWNYHTSCRTWSRYPVEPSGAGGDRGFRLVVVGKSGCAETEKAAKIEVALRRLLAEHAASIRREAPFAYETDTLSGDPVFMQPDWLVIGKWSIDLSRSLALATLEKRHGQGRGPYEVDIVEAELQTKGDSIVLLNWRVFTAYGGKIGEYALGTIGGHNPTTGDTLESRSDSVKEWRSCASPTPFDCRNGESKRERESKRGRSKY